MKSLLSILFVIAQVYSQWSCIENYGTNSEMCSADVISTSCTVTDFCFPTTGDFFSEFVCFQDSIDVRTSAEPDCSLIITAVSVPPTCSAQQVTVPAGDGLALFCNEPLSIDVSNSVVQNLFMNPDCTGDVFSINAFAADTCISLSNSSASMGVGSIIYQGCADGNTTVTQLSFSDQECTVPLANQTLSPIDVCVGGSLFTCGSTQAQVTGIAPTDTTDSSDSSSSGNILTISLFFTLFTAALTFF